MSAHLVQKKPTTTTYLALLILVEKPSNHPVLEKLQSFRLGTNTKDHLLQKHLDWRSPGLEQEERAGKTTNPIF